jgi:hypothetical protein
MPGVSFSFFGIGVSFSNDEVKEFRNLLGTKAKSLFKAEKKDFVGNFYISAKHSKKYLDVADERKDDTANVFQYSFHGGENQQWTIVKASEGFYFIFAKHSGKCLDVADERKDNNANVFQYSFHGGDNQQWELREAEDGYVYIIAKHSNMALSVEGWKQEDRANIVQQTPQGGDNQKWKLKSVSMQSTI